MIFRAAIAALILTVLATACNNKVWVECPATTYARTKNRALTINPNETPTEAKTC